MNDMVHPLLINNDDGNTNHPDRQPFGVHSAKTANGFLQMRYILILLVCFGSFNIYATRVTMSMALVCMVNHTAILQNSHPITTQMKNASVIKKCNQADVIDIEANKEDGPFLWDEELQGIILSSFFWGYVFTQLLGGFLADRFGGKLVCAISVMVSSLFTMTIPVAAQLHPTLVILSRVFCGLAQGVFFPTTFSIASKWIPKQERSRFIALLGTGVALGITLTFPLSAALCKSHLFGGWPGIFYVIGSFGLLWSVIWFLLMFENPAKHPWISAEERCYILQNCFCDSDRNQIKIPWKRILTSPPVLSLCILEFCSSFKFFMMLTQLPTYLKVILNFTIQQNGYINIIPSMVSVVIGFLASYAADTLVSKSAISITMVRKAFTFTGSFSSWICLIGVTLVGCDRIWITVLILISASIESMSLAGSEANALDLSPNFTDFIFILSVIKGILNTMSAAAGIAAPYTVGILTKNNNTKSSWNIAFYVAVGLSMFGMLIYLIFGSGNTQPWNNTIQDNEDTDVDTNEKVVLKETTQLVK